MRRLHPGALLLAVSLALPLASQEPWEAPAQVPARVRYKQMDAAELRPTVDKLRRVLAPDYQGDEQLVREVLLVGPFLWKRWSQSKELKGPGTPLEFKVPMAKGELLAIGRRIDPADIAAAHRLLRADAGGGLRVRRLTPQELDLLWSIYPFDLEDPLLMLETDQHQFVAAFLKGELFYLDDFQGAALESLGRISPPRLPFPELARAHWAKTPTKQGKGVKPVELQLVLVNPDEVYQRAIVFDDWIKFLKGQQAVLNKFSPKFGKNRRNLGVQLEVWPDRVLLLKVHSDPPLTPEQTAQLSRALKASYVPPVKELIEVQFFAQLWGGKPK